MASLVNRYAQALLGAAEAAGATAAVEGDLGALGEALSARALRTFLEHPDQPGSRKIEALERILAARGRSMHEVTRRLLGVLERRGRLGLLPELCGRFHELALEARGEAEGVIYTTAPLSEAEVAEVATALGRITGKKVSLVQETDPDLCGGFVVRLGDRMFDNSLRGRIEALGAKLKALPIESLARSTGDG